MYPGEVFIDVWNCHARVARYLADANGDITWEYALNWEELEDLAAEAVDDAGGWLTASGHYSCPSDLAKRAVWPEQVTET